MLPQNTNSEAVFLKLCVAFKLDSCNTRTIMQIGQQIGLVMSLEVLTPMSVVYLIFIIKTSEILQIRMYLSRDPVTLFPDLTGIVATELRQNRKTTNRPDPDWQLVMCC